MNRVSPQDIALPAAAEMPRPDDVLWAFYDLEVSPTGYDFATFLALAALAARRRGSTAFHVVIVPALDAAEAPAASEPLNEEQRRNRVDQLLVPLTELMPDCTGVSVCATRQEAEGFWRHQQTCLFPDGYAPARPVADAFQWAYIVAALSCGETLPSWRATGQARQEVDAWLAPRVNGRHVITITLREASYFSSQNSTLDAWTEFLRSLDPAVYFPVILRDTEKASDPLPPPLVGFASFGPASLDVRLRAALYERAALNMMSANGPMQLLWLNPELASLVFIPIAFDNPRGCPVPLRSMGFEPGPHPWPSGPRHRLIWKRDSAANLSAGFASLAPELLSPTKNNLPLKESSFLTARRLRTTGRNAAARIYAHLAAGEPAAATAGLSLTAIEASSSKDDRNPWRHWWHEWLAGLQSGTANSDDIEALAEIGEWCRRYFRPGRAEALFRRILTCMPEHTDALYQLGLLQLERGRLAEALEPLRIAAAATPYLAHTHYAYGEALIATGNRSAALAEFAIAAQNDPSHVLARLHLAAWGEPVPPATRSLDGNGVPLILICADEGGYACYFGGNRFFAVPGLRNNARLQRRGDRIQRLEQHPTYAAWFWLRRFLPPHLGEKIEMALRRTPLGQPFYRKNYIAGVQSAETFPALRATIARAA
jgi:tetratricopeptide (TPR) repeat protein